MGLQEQGSDNEAPDQIDSRALYRQGETLQVKGALPARQFSRLGGDHS